MPSSFLSDEYLKGLEKEYKTRILFPAPAPTPISTPSRPQVSEKIYSDTPVRRQGDISKEEQIKKFGGEIGSPEYYETKSKISPGASLLRRTIGPVGGGAVAGFVIGGPLGAAIGAGLGGGIAANLFPDQETWDRMSTTDKISHIGYRTAEFPINLAMSLPSFFIKAIPNLIATVARPVAEKTSPFDLAGVQKLAKSEQEQPYNIPVGGELDPLYGRVIEGYNTGKQLGWGDNMSTVLGYVQGGVDIFNNALVGYTFATGLKGLVKPPKRLAPGEKVTETGSIQEALAKSEQKLAAGAGKPAKDGPASIYQSVPKEFEKEVAGKTGQGGRVYYKFTPAGENSVEVSLVQSRGGLVSDIKNRFGLGDEKAIQGAFGKEIKIESHIVKIEGVTEKAGKVEPISEPYKGSENNPITRNQVENLSNIAKMNGFDPAVKDVVVRTMTGKKIVGDLTNAEYVKVAKTLSSANRLGEFSVGKQASLWTKYVGQYISPARSWMEAVQRKTNIPIYDAWLDLENGVRLSRNSAQGYMQEGRTILGKYADDKFIEERRLIDAHMRGDPGAIINNKNLAPETKTELLKAVDGISQFFEDYGPDLGVPKEFYRKNAAGYYLPDILDLGGIVQKYKKGAEIPKGKEFFATKLKGGGDYVRVDDPLKLIDIYAKQGSEAKFLDDPIARAYNLNKTTMPAEFRESFRSAVLEKLGYAGQFEKFLDDISVRLNQKLNRNIPPDLGRKINQGLLTYFYANVLSSPTTWIRNELMNNIMLHMKWGGEYWAQAKLKAVSPEGMAEVRAKGFLNESSAAFGADIGTIGGKMKKGADIALAPVGYADSLGRTTAYFDTKFHFENAIKLYNEGKITWAKAEKMLDLDGMSPIEANRVRRMLNAGDMEGAFDELARSVIDETNFPYRKGSSARITFGAAGNVATFLYKWNIEFTHSMGRMLRTGQFDKLIRYYTASMITVKSIEESNGVDFSSSVGTGPLEQRYPASIQIGLDLISVLQKGTGENAEALDDAKDKLTRSLTTFGIPGGVDTKNWQDFWRSYSKGPVDREGRYNIIGPKGDILEAGPVPFSELWMRLWGMPTQIKVDSRKAKAEILSYQYQLSQAKRKVAELRNMGKDSEADDLVLQWESRGEDIEPGNQSYDRFDTPQLERIFDKLTPTGQERFESKVYPK